MRTRLFSFCIEDFKDDVVYVSKDGFLFSTPREVYSTNIFRYGKLELVIHNFFARYVEEFADSFFVVGFFFDDRSFVRKGGIISLSKGLDIISKKVFDDSVFSDFVWGDSTVVCANCYDLSENIFRGYIFRYDDVGFYRVKIDPILFGEYEIRGGIKVNEDRYLFFGVDKDNFRGFVLEGDLSMVYLHDISINSDLWDIVGCSYFNEESFIFVGNEWKNYSKGFVLIFENGQYTYIPIDYNSSWFEVLGVANIREIISIPIYDFDSGQSCLLRFDGEKFDVLLMDEYSKFVCYGNKVFVVSRGSVEEFVIE